MANRLMIRYTGDWTSKINHDLIVLFLRYFDVFVFNFIPGEETWPGQCHSGQKQSPIDLAKDASVIGRYSPLVFKNYDKLLKNSTIRNTGHSCKFDISISYRLY